ncbi:MAG: hypothetical protein ACOH2A_06245 [Sphingobacteriaceae bacterium]
MFLFARWKERVFFKFDHGMPFKGRLLSPKFTAANRVNMFLAWGIILPVVIAEKQQMLCIFN